MSPEKQRIKIAEACGESTACVCPNHGEVPRERIGDAMSCPWCGSYCDNETPDYLNDLNAMHAAVMALNDQDLTECINHLRLITQRGKKHEIRSYVDQGAYKSRLLALATAAQWAEAFLRTGDRRKNSAA